MRIALSRWMLVLGVSAWPACAVAQSHATHDPHAGHAAQTTPPAHATHATHDPARQPADASGDAADPHAGHAMPAPAAGLPREPVPEPTDADRQAAFQELYFGHHDAHGDSVNSLVSITRLEGWDSDPGTGLAWELGAWIGTDLQRAWLRSEGEREDGSTKAADLEVFYGRALGPWSELLLGLRQDVMPDPSRTWAAIGIEGLTPYKFEVSAMAYLGEAGRSMFTVDVEYDLLLTNRLILQPKLGFEAQGHDDPQLGMGSGLSAGEVALRLRYELAREFAPYIGVVHQRAFGGTADYQRQAGEAIRDTRWVAGVRWWF